MSFEYILHWPQMNDRKSHWWLVNIGSGIALVPSGNKPLPEPMLTHTYVATGRHLATMS